MDCLVPKALVVDDNAMNLELAVFALELEGFAVRTARDVEGFNAALQAELPDIVLMDVQLPGTDGLELTRRMKSNPATAGIAVVAVTAYAMKGDEQRILEAGCDGYISKPIDVENFGQRVRSFLRR